MEVETEEKTVDMPLNKGTEETSRKVEDTDVVLKKRKIEEKEDYMHLKNDLEICKKVGDTSMEPETGEIKEMPDDMQLNLDTKEINSMVWDTNVELVTWEIKEKAEDMQLNLKAWDTNVGLELDTREIKEKTDDVQLNQDPEVISREAGITVTDHTEENDMIGTLLIEIHMDGDLTQTLPCFLAALVIFLNLELKYSIKQ